MAPARLTVQLNLTVDPARMTADEVADRVTRSRREDGARHPLRPMFPRRKRLGM
jgi:hypothetical protein